MSLSIFASPLAVNEQLITSENRHLLPEQLYKHCDFYHVPEELQSNLGTNWSLLAIYHSQEDVVRDNILTSFGKLAVGVPHIYLVEQSLDGQLEKIYLLPVLSGLEIGGKHYFFAQVLGILSRVVEAGELMLQEDGTIEFNALTGTFMNFNENNFLVLKTTPIDQYFQKLGEIHGITFKKVRRALIERSMTKKDIQRFSSSGRVFCNVPHSECDKSNWQLVGQDVLDDTCGIPLGAVLSQRFDEIVVRPEVNKILSASQLRKEKPSHFARPLGNFLQSQTVERAQDLSVYWPKIIAGSEIPREDFEKILDEFKVNETVIHLTVEMFLGPSGNIFKKELPDAIKQMLE